MEAPMHHKIAVVGCGCESRVIPGALVASNGDTIEISGVDSEIHVWLPWKTSGEALHRGNKERRVVLEITNYAPGVYQYGVYHVETRSMAEGHSSPKIIIDR